jgi:hypothetical protein
MQDCEASGDRSFPSGRLATLAICVLAALLFVAGAAASLLAHESGDAPQANSASFTDPTGDALGDPPDITAVTVSNDDAGILTFRLTFPNRPQLRQSPTDPGARDFVSLLFDNDRNGQTGCAGAEFAVGAGPRFDTPSVVSAVSFECVNGQIEPRVLVTASFVPATQTLEVTFDRSVIGSPAGFDLAVASSTTFGGAAGFDSAGEWPYTIVAPPPGTTTTAPTTTTTGERDTTRPEVKALRSAGRRGRIAKLRYTVFDVGGRTREEVRVYRGARRIGLVRTGLGETRGSQIYVVSWRVPRSAPRALRFCVRAWDESGNRSRASCAPLAIR